MHLLSFLPEDFTCCSPIIRTQLSMPPPKGAWNPVEGPADYTMTKLVHNDTYPEIDPTKSDYTGKSVFISGASRAAAKAAGRKEPKVLQVKIDISDEKSVNEGVKKIESEFESLDVVINNAGIIHMDKEAKLHQQDSVKWLQQMQINIFGTYLLTRSIIPLVLKSSLKTLISISSVGATCISPGLSAYQISKMATTRLQEFIAVEYTDEGLIAFSVHPGNVLTDIVGNGEGMDEKLKSVFTESREICADTLVKLSEVRREWLSGRYVNVTWDMPEFLSDKRREEIVSGDLLKLKMAV
ncbi:Short chain dehydrogenase citE [Pseudocercospora fuligena]|uniref:Short chain dehydrogenase citE n=1 Tax=Pseudocercospora fuligena TaxID=685502 RepID=A0A8H6VS36_9PEZI|nr:Short chain dehydrogenase citE [Pseudocercospora fuligena]